MAFDDQSSLVQRFAEEPQLSSAGKPKPILEVAFNPSGAYVDVENQVMQKAAEKTKKMAEKAYEVAQDTQVKVAKKAKHVKKAIKKRMVEAGEQMHAAKKLAKSKMKPLWRKDKDSTDYGVLDSMVEKARAKYNSKVAEKTSEALVKSQELGNRFSDTVIQKVPQNMMPMMAPVMNSPFGPAPPVGDDPWSQQMAHPPKTDMEIAEAVHKFRQAEEEAKIKKRQLAKLEREERRKVKESYEQINEEDFADGSD